MRLTAKWFGVLKQPTFPFLGEYNKWSAELRTNEEKAMEPAAYWRSKQNACPRLYKAGLWNASIPLSAIAAERSVALMREIETPKRNRLRETQWHAENFIRYNKWVTQLDFDDVSKDVAAVTAGTRSPLVAAAVAVAAAATASPPAAPGHIRHAR